MCSVYSAVLGDTLAVVDDYQATGTQVKHSLAARLGVTRFRRTDSGKSRMTNKFWAERLMVLDFLLPDFEEDQRMISPAKSNDVGTLQNLLNCPRSGPLLYAEANGYMEPLQLLIEAAADLNARATGPDGWTALLLVAQSGHVDRVRCLIEAGAGTDLATLDLNGTTIHLATERGHAEVVQVLLEAGMGHSKARKQRWVNTLVHCSSEYADIVDLLIMAGRLSRLTLVTSKW